MIKLENVTKQYPTGNTALSDITFTIDQGDFVFLVGPSGSGKTTLLRMLIRDSIPTSGSISIGEWDLIKLPDAKVPHLRKKIGVVFQDLKLLRDRTIFENILFPLEVVGMDQLESKKRVEDILEQVGIMDHKDKFPIQLSGGEMQRAAIARALAFSPEIILADEPTGNLDNTTSWEIVKLLQDINNLGTTVIMATHNTDIVNSLLKRTITLEKGKLVKDTPMKGVHKEKHTK
jgi:cell division transport system ATP-binding protein